MENSFFKSFNFKYLLFVPIFMYGLYANLWNSTISGDEPHYIFTGISIWEDGDCNVKNNYENEELFPSFYGKIDWHAHAGPNNFVIGRGITTPLMTVIPFQFFGVQGVKYFMFIINSFLVILIFQICKYVIKDDFLSVLTTLVYCCSKPFTYGSSMIFGDLTGGIIILYGLFIIKKLLDENEFKLTLINSFFCLSLHALLPLMHFKFIIPSIIFLVVYVYILSKKSGKIENIKSSIISVFITYSIFWSLTVYYYVFVLKGLGGHNTGIDFKVNIMQFLMYNIDIDSGLFFLMPQLIFSLFFLKDFFNENKIFISVFLLNFFLITLLSCYNLDSGVYTKLGIHGHRYVWQTAPMFIFLFVLMIKKMYKTNVIKMYILMGFLFIYQFIEYVLNIKRPLIDIIWESSVNTIFSKVSNITPHFKNPELYYKSTTNYLYIFIFLAIIIYALLNNNLKNLISKNIKFGLIFIVLLFSILGIVNILNSKNIKVITYKASDMSRNVGEIKTDIVSSIGKVGFCGIGANGFMNYGPYTSIKPGKYKVKFYIRLLTKNKEECFANIDIADKGFVLASSGVCINNFTTLDKYEIFTLEFKTYNSLNNFETRVLTAGTEEFYFEKSELEQIETYEEGLYVFKDIASIPKDSLFKKSLNNSELVSLVLTQDSLHKTYLSPKMSFISGNYLLKMNSNVNSSNLENLILEVLNEGVVFATVDLGKTQGEAKFKLENLSRNIEVRFVNQGRKSILLQNFRIERTGEIWDKL